MRGTHLQKIRNDMEVSIKTNGDALDLPLDYSIDIEDTNPITNDRGSQSIPGTIPCTPKNMRLLGFPHMMDSVADLKRPLQKAMVQCGVYNRQGLINMVSANRKEGITFNIGFDNSEVYEKWKNKKLPDLSSMPVFHIPDVVTDDVWRMKVWMDKVFSGEIDMDFAVFPLVVDNPSVSSGENDEHLPFMLNRVVASDSPDGAEWHLKFDTKVMQVIDGEKTEVTVPDGYGVTGFVYVWRVLELVFADLGLTLDKESNPMWNDVELRRLVILNGCADAICTGMLNYSDMMPDTTVEDFLNSLWVRFGLVYNVDFNTLTVDVRLVRDIMDLKSGTDITESVTDYPTVNFESPKYISLSAKTSIDGAGPDNERFEDFAKGMDLSEVSFAPEFDVALKRKLVYELMSGQFHRYDSVNDKYISSGSAFFNWDPQPEGLDAEELSSEDEFVPVKKIEGEWLPCFLTGPKHRHTMIKGREDSEDSTPLSFLFAFVNPENVDHTYGSWHSHTPDGEGVVIDGVRHTLSLLFQFSDGLFYKFWRKYDERLRHAFNTVDVDVRLPMEKLQNLDMFTPLIISGQLLLIDKMSYSLPARKAVDVELSIKSLMPKGVYDLDNEHSTLNFGSVSNGLMWVRDSDTLDSGIEAAEEAAVLEWNLTYGNDKFKKAYKTDAKNISYLSPTWDKDNRLVDNPPKNIGEYVEYEYYFRAEYEIWVRKYPNIPGDSELRRSKYSYIPALPGSFTVRFKAVGY